MCSRAGGVANRALWFQLQAEWTTRYSIDLDVVDLATAELINIFLCQRIHGRQQIAQDIVYLIYN